MLSNQAMIVLVEDVPKARTARQRAREEITGEILSAARRRLTEAGPGELSLRAVARDVGMVSSAVYRYFSSRDELLTALLISAYDELGAFVEAADDAVADEDLSARWRATCTAVRTWALAHPHDYALLYGSPVSGYAAPQDTIEPATRVIRRLVLIIVLAHDSGRALPEPPHDAPPGFATATVGAQEAINRFEIDAADTQDAPPELVGRTLMAWTNLFGTISFELWGHLVGSVDDHAAYFDGVVARLWADLSTRD